MSNEPIRSVPTVAASPPRRGMRWTLPVAVGLGAVAGATLAGALLVSLSAEAEPTPVAPTPVEQQPVSAPTSSGPPRTSAPAQVTTRPASSTTLGEIDPAVAERAPTKVSSPTAGAVDLEPVTSVGDTAADRPAYLIIQDEIDRSLAELKRARGER